MACSLTLEAALQSCSAFLEEHPSEFLILRSWDVSGAFLAHAEV